MNNKIGRVYQIPVKPQEFVLSSFLKLYSNKRKASYHDCKFGEIHGGKHVNIECETVNPWIFFCQETGPMY